MPRHTCTRFNKCHAAARRGILSNHSCPTRDDVPCISKRGSYCTKPASTGTDALPGSASKSSDDSSTAAGHKGFRRRAKKLLRQLDAVCCHPVRCYSYPKSSVTSVSLTLSLILFRAVMCKSSTHLKLRTSLQRATGLPCVPIGDVQLQNSSATRTRYGAFVVINRFTAQLCR